MDLFAYHIGRKVGMIYIFLSLTVKQFHRYEGFMSKFALDNSFNWPILNMINFNIIS